MGHYISVVSNEVSRIVDEIIIVICDRQRALKSVSRDIPVGAIRVSARSIDVCDIDTYTAVYSTKVSDIEWSRAISSNRLPYEMLGMKALSKKKKTNTAIGEIHLVIHGSLLSREIKN